MKFQIEIRIFRNNLTLGTKWNGFCIQSRVDLVNILESGWSDTVKVDGQAEMDCLLKIDIEPNRTAIRIKWTAGDDFGPSFEPTWTIMSEIERSFDFN